MKNLLFKRRKQELKRYTVYAQIDNQDVLITSRSLFGTARWYARRFHNARGRRVMVHIYDSKICKIIEQLDSEEPHTPLGDRMPAQDLPPKIRVYICPDLYLTI